MGGYEIELSGANALVSTLAWDPDWASQDVTVDCAGIGAVGEGNYEVKVRALHVDGVNNSAWSETVPFALDATGGVVPLGIPSGLRIVPK
jgi:hypothetical protein